jgi:hypothetical protein
MFLEYRASIATFWEEKKKSLSNVWSHLVKSILWHWQLRFPAPRFLHDLLHLEGYSDHFQ